VIALLRAGVDVDGVDRYRLVGDVASLIHRLIQFRRGALWHAARAGRPDVARHLLANGADPNLRDGNYDEDLISRSLHNIDDLSEASFAQDYPYGGVSPIFAAAHFGHPETVALLLAAGADPDRVLNDGRSALQTAVGRVSNTYIAPIVS